MKNITVVIFSILLALPSLAKVTQPSFWTATKGKYTIYLFGTYHMRVTGDEVPSEVWNSLKRSEPVMVERNIVNRGNDQFVEYNLQDPSYRSFHLKKTAGLSDQEWDFLEKDMRRRRHDLNMYDVDRLSPLLVEKIWDHTEADIQFQAKNQTLDQQVVVRSSVRPMELDVLVHTDSNSKDFISVKTFKGLVDARMKAGLDQSLINDKQNIDNEANKYRAGDCGHLSDAGYATMVTSRNRAWMRLILKYMTTSKPLFVGVGCAHMDETQKTGLVNLLKDQGFTVVKDGQPEIPQPAQNAPSKASVTPAKAP